MMRVEIERDRDGKAYRVIGLCNLPGWGAEKDVISFNLLLGIWRAGSSMCLPSNLTTAIKVHKTVAMAFEALDKIMEDD